MLRRAGRRANYPRNAGGPGPAQPFVPNFGLMVGHIKSGPVFAGLGIGLEVPTVTTLFTLFEKRGWLYRYRWASVSSARRVVGG